MSRKNFHILFYSLFATGTHQQNLGPTSLYSQKRSHHNRHPAHTGKAATVLSVGQVTHRGQGPSPLPECRRVAFVRVEKGVDASRRENTGRVFLLKDLGNCSYVWCRDSLLAVYFPGCTFESEEEDSRQPQANYPAISDQIYLNFKAGTPWIYLETVSAPDLVIAV
ncbi:hypothetical protein P167DRAFT_549843 [Morchella conica CCBAS932]|uniref:Uncharacterized protein n=1 Tax=Morchella conica CCBAS932 TaxID=1392247 RepID=A0A3N4K9V4_9PEZI|nr:hypothetical protein P167DRAFT_549843 [Morchella conica CCBAS932]